MGVIRSLLSAIVFIAIVAVIIFGGFFAYQNYLKSLPSQYGSVDAPNEISQFVHYLRFADSKISYFINSNCDSKRTAKILEAMKIISDSAPEISFYASSEASADILIGCSKNSYEQETNVFIAGEGGPTSYLNLSYYPLIKRGKVILYQKSDCDYPVVEIHEFLHVFGFDHVNNKSSIMFPYAMCEARLDSGIAEVLKQIYSVEPATELYFVNASAKAFNGYLNISVAITNQGLLNAEKFNLDLYADGNKLEPVEIDPIEVGQTSMLKVSNIKLPRKAISLLEMDINYLEKEFDKANNKISIRLESLE